MTGLPAQRWRWLVFRAGDWVCPTHGPIAPAGGLVPHCAEPDGERPCMRIALRAVPDSTPGRRGRVVFAWPQPDQCPAGHPLAPAAVSITWAGCRCTPAGGHRIWCCTACPRGALPAMWPPACPLWLESRAR